MTLDGREVGQLDPLPNVGLTPAAAQALLDVRVAGATERPGPGSDSPGNAEFYLGMREAEADLAARIEAKAKTGDHSVAAADAHELTVYAFHSAVDAHARAITEPDAVKRARLFGARKAFLVTYGELALRDTEHMDAPDIADRMVEALNNGITDTELLVRAAWESNFPILLTAGDISLAP
ncbi:MAG: hypothetical protein FWE61_10790 [Micrococcales bacterium]|nr:hypothetical protein [Micrococcales bacterium]